MNNGETRRAFLLVEESDAATVCEAIHKVVDGCSIERFETREELLDAVFGEKQPATRPLVVVSQSKVFMETESLVAELRNAPLFLPTIVLRIEPNTRNINKPEKERHHLDSVFSVFQPFDETKIVNAITDANYLADDFFRLQRNMIRFESLTAREVEIVRLATEGVPNKSIARRLNISIKTVEKNRQSAYSKLQISSAAEMATMVTFHRYCWASPALMPQIGIG